MRWFLVLLLPILTSMPAAATDWFPLEPGHAWTYRDAFGEEHVSRVLSVEDTADGRYAILTNPDAEAALDLLTHLRDPAGSISVVARYQEQGPGYTTRSTSLSEPLVRLDATVAAGWTSSPRFTVRVDGTFTWEYDECWQNLIAGEESIEVPLGTFRAVRVSTGPCPGFHGLPFDTWYAEGVGMVHQEVPGRPLRLSLVSFSPGGVAMSRGSWGSVKALYGN